MKIIDTKKSSDEVSFLINIESDNWDLEQKKIAKSLISNIKMDGYRKGKVPYEIAIKRIHPSEIFNRALDKVLKNTTKEIIETQQFKEIEDDILDLPPSVNVTKLDKKELEFEFKYALYPEVIVDGYKDIKITSQLKEVKREDIQKEIDNILSRHSMSVPKEKGAISKGDIATFDFKGFISGKEFEGGQAKNYELKIGSNQFIPGFEEQMIGMNVGDKKDINVTFPSDYHKKELANKAARFEVIIHSISSVETPKLDDEFVKTLKIKDVDSVDGLNKFLETRLSTVNKQNFEQEQKKEVYQAIANVLKIDKIPSILIEKEKNKLIRNIEYQIKMYNMELDKYLKLMNITKEQFEKEQYSTAEQNLKISMALLKICELENIEATEAELNEELEKAVKKYNMKKEEILKNVNNDLSIFESFVIERKVIDFFTNRK